MNDKLNETKLVGVVASKVNQSQMKDKKFISSFILKINNNGVHILVKFVGKRPVEFNKGNEIWVKGELCSVKNFKGEYEIALKATAYKVHTSESDACGRQKQLPKRQRNYQVNQDLMDEINDVFNNASLDDLD